MKVFVSPTTGGHLEVCVSQQETVRGLKQVLARKYRIAPARLHLLHKDRYVRMFFLYVCVSVCVCVCVK